MTSNTRVVVTGAGLAGVRLARRLGELGVFAVPAGDEEHTPYDKGVIVDDELRTTVRHDRSVGGVVLVGEIGTVGALARAREGAEPLPSDGGPRSTCSPTMEAPE